MLRTQNTARIGRILCNKSSESTIDVGISIKPIFSELCTTTCKNKNLLWDAPLCYKCVYNQLFPGTMRKYKKTYPEYRGLKR